MGRRNQTLPALDPEIIREAFPIRDGAIVRKSTGEPACFRGPHNRLLVRVYRDGKIRRIIAWPHRVGDSVRLLAKGSGAAAQWRPTMISAWRI
jgi:hypothetical protein